MLWAAMKRKVEMVETVKHMGEAVFDVLGQESEGQAWMGRLAGMEKVDFGCSTSICVDECVKCFEFGSTRLQTRNAPLPDDMQVKWR